MKTVLVTGGTGMLGTLLANYLVESGYQVIILSRSSHKASMQGISYALWDTNKGFIDENAIKKADYIVHLAGENLASGRWTDKRKKTFIDSRVKSSELISDALQDVPNKVSAVISASAIGYYGDDKKGPGRPFDETDPPADYFLGNLVQKWEASIQDVTNSGKRLVLLRSGAMLSKTGGAYKEFKMPLKFGICSILGNGKQVLSWIHILDSVRLIKFCMENERINGIYNAVSPYPEKNSTIMKTIARHNLNRYLCVTVPAFVIKILFGEMSIEVLKSATVDSGKIRKEGFEFLYPDIESAIQQLESSAHL